MGKNNTKPRGKNLGLTNMGRLEVLADPDSLNVTAYHWGEAGRITLTETEAAFFAGIVLHWLEQRNQACFCTHTESKHFLGDNHEACSICSCNKYEAKG